MASPAPRTAVATQGQEGSELKHLGFFRAFAITVLAFVSTLHSEAKDKAGNLKPAIDSVEGIFWSWLTPLYNAAAEKSYRLLVFADKKVDQILALTKSYLNFWKAVVFYGIGLIVEAQELTKQAIMFFKDFISDLWSLGPKETAKAYWGKYEPVLEDAADKAWKFALKLPLVPQAVELATPAVFFAGGFYNQFMLRAKEVPVPLVKPVLEMMPILPVERVERKVHADVKAALGAPVA